MKVSLFEIFLIQLVLYTALWLVDEYVASYICIVIPAIAIVLTFVAFLAELIEPSKVPRKYYSFMLISTITPIVVGGFFVYLYRGQLDWLQGI